MSLLPSHTYYLPAGLPTYLCYGSRCARLKTTLAWKYRSRVVSCEFHLSHVPIMHLSLGVLFHLFVLHRSQTQINCLATRPVFHSNLQGSGSIRVRRIQYGLWIFFMQGKVLGRGWPSLQLNIHDVSRRDSVLPRYALDTSILAGSWLHLTNPAPAHS